MKELDLATETIDIEEAAAGTQIDDAGKVVKNVVILTGKKVSKNRTSYQEGSLREAVSRYEGSKMYLDHAKKGEGNQNRSVRDLAAVYRNVRRDGDKVIADAHVMEAHWPIVSGIARLKPKGTGLSIRDKGHGAQKDGVFLVEGFSGDSFSVDLVTEASVNKDLFESRNEGGDMDFKALNLEALAKERPDLVESIKATAKAELATQIEEATKKGEKAEGMILQAQKTLLIAEAALPAELTELAKSSVLPGGVTLEEAKGLVTKFKETAAKLKPAAGKSGAGEPKVRGAGAEKPVEEGVTEALPSDEDIAAAFDRR